LLISAGLFDTLTERGCLHGSCWLLAFKVLSAAAVSAPVYFRSTGLFSAGAGHTYGFNVDCGFE